MNETPQQTLDRMLRESSKYLYIYSAKNNMKDRKAGRRTEAAREALLDVGRLVFSAVSDAEFLIIGKASIHAIVRYLHVRVRTKVHRRGFR